MKINNLFSIFFFLKLLAYNKTFKNSKNQNFNKSIINWKKGGEHNVHA